MMMKRRNAVLSMAATAMLPTMVLGQPVAPTAVPALRWTPVVQHYSAMVLATYEDTLAAAVDLQNGIRQFTQSPTAEGLEKSRQAWLAARELYGQTEVFRFYGGPIDNDKGPEGRLNAWPMDEAYVDAVKGKPGAGLIQNPRFKITKASLSGANERGGEENISTGWHAIEFLLWGQDLNDQGPGARSHEDFVDGKAPHAERRRLYLNVVADLLVDDLRYLVEQWAPGKRNYRANFDRGERESVRRILVGMGSLSRGELAGERMEVALNSQDQEDEHSCFSDNTHRDIVTNALGIQNVWLGRYARRDGAVLQGASLADLVATRDRALAERITLQLRQSVDMAQSIPRPFDQAIAKGATGRAVVEKTVDSLVEQSKLLVSAASAIGITKLTLAQP